MTQLTQYNPIQRTDVVKSQPPNSSDALSNSGKSNTIISQEETKTPIPQQKIGLTQSKSSQFISEPKDNN